MSFHFIFKDIWALSNRTTSLSHARNKHLIPRCGRSRDERFRPFREEGRTRGLGGWESCRQTALHQPLWGWPQLRGDTLPKVTPFPKVACILWLCYYARCYGLAILARQGRCTLSTPRGAPRGCRWLTLLLSLSLCPLPLLSLPLASVLVLRALLNHLAAQVHCRGCLLRNPPPDSGP